VGSAGVSAIALVLAACALWLARLVLGALFAQQVKGALPEYTARRVRTAAGQLPEQLRRRYEEEWLAELEAQREKPLSALRFAHSLQKAARAISAQAEGSVEAGEAAMMARVADTLVAGLALLLYAPLLGMVATVVKLRHGGRILDRSRAFGRGGTAIELFSFSTTDKRTGHTSAIGRFLRRTSLYQLPVLINVIRGDVALIGPLAQRPVGVKMEPRKLAVRPGLVSWRRLAESRVVEIGLDEARRRDENRSLRNDLVLLVNLPRFALRAERVDALAERECRCGDERAPTADETR
jgi:lipopolysaccharide/colanic/teichoic acid biosynthesis glycosyltransferase